MHPLAARVQMSQSLLEATPSRPNLQGFGLPAHDHESVARHQTSNSSVQHAKNTNGNTTSHYSKPFIDVCLAKMNVKENKKFFSSHQRLEGIGQHPAGKTFENLIAKVLCRTQEELSDSVVDVIRRDIGITMKCSLAQLL
jgi:hypothetical protein